MTIALNRPPADFRLAAPVALPYTRATRELRVALHRRRRSRRRAFLTVGFTVVVVLAAIGVLAMRPPAEVGSDTVVTGSAPAATPISGRTHVVAPGETLWGIAKAEYPHRDPRLVVADLAKTNHLDGALVSGRTLRLP